MPDVLIRAYMEDKLSGIRMICKNELCDKVINMTLAQLTIIRAEEFDTYMFKCPHCGRILKVEFDYKKGKENEINNRTEVQKESFVSIGGSV